MSRASFYKIKKLYSITIVITGLLLLYSLAGSAQTKSAEIDVDSFKADSTALRILIFKLLKWHQADRGEDFAPKLSSPNDSIYTGIDWMVHQNRMEQLKNTGFFTEEFLSNYQKIAVYLDAEFKQNKQKYYVGDLPPYDHVNEWCNCQDYPTNVWKRLKITNVKLNGNLANFNWTWAPNHSYFVKAKKTNGKWQILQFEKFDIKNFIW